MVSIQPFSFQFCTAFRERKQLADKTNEIIEVLNSADLENLPTEIERIDQNVADLGNYTSEIDANLTHRIDLLEEEIDKDWILCPSDLDFFDLDNNKVNYDLKILYSLTFEYQHTNVDNPNDKIITGSIFLNKNDPIDATESLIFKMENAIFDDIYNIVFADTGITPAIIDYGFTHSPMQLTFRGTAFNPSNGTCRVRTKTSDVNFQTNDMTLSFSNPFINIYYKGE